MQIYEHRSKNVVGIDCVLFVPRAERDHTEADIPQTAHQPVPRDGKIPAGAHRPRPHRLRGHQVRNKPTNEQTRVQGWIILKNRWVNVN